MQTSFNVGELRRVIKESSSEFKPVLGPGVESDNKKNNEKSYKEAEKRAKEFDGGLKAPEKKGKLPEKDINRTTLDYTLRTEPSKEYKERIEAQALGYTSKLEMENGIEKVGDFEGNKRIYQQFKDSSDKVNSAKTDLAHSGLQARMHDKKEFEKPTMYESQKPKAKRLTFKHTEFVNESQVLVRIPEQYKVDGQIIHMCDCKDNVYVVECVKSEHSGNIETNIISHTNKRLVSENLDRIKQLMDYKSDTNGKFNKLNVLKEQEEFNTILNLTRGKK